MCGAHQKCLCEALLMSTINICFCWELRKNISSYLELGSRYIFYPFSAEGQVQQTTFWFFFFFFFFQRIALSNFNEMTSLVFFENYFWWIKNVISYTFASCFRIEIINWNCEILASMFMYIVYATGTGVRGSTYTWMSSHIMCVDTRHCLWYSKAVGSDNIEK